jgi:hypothetical protein
MIPRISDDPEVLERIYRHFDYLRGFPLRLQGSFIDDAVNLGVLADDDFLGFLMAYDVDEERAEAERFPFLKAEENRAITRYRHVRPVGPWPQPIVGIAWNAAAGEGRVLGTHHVDVVLKNVGNAQLWWGGEVGVIWEAFFEERVRERSNHELLMHQLWDALECDLAERGVRCVFTYEHDPALDDAWYQAFLTNRDYRRDVERNDLPGGRVALMKELA